MRQMRWLIIPAVALGLFIAQGAAAPVMAAPRFKDLAPESSNWRCPAGYRSLKIDGGRLANRTVDDGTLFVTISNYDGGEDGVIDWRLVADKTAAGVGGVDYVFMKGGQNGGGRLYIYNPEATSGANLSTPINPSGKPAGLSHLIFCYDLGDSTPSSPTNTPSPTPTQASNPGNPTQPANTPTATPTTPSNSTQPTNTATPTTTGNPNQPVSTPTATATQPTTTNIPTATATAPGGPGPVQPTATRRPSRDRDRDPDPQPTSTPAPSAPAPQPAVSAPATEPAVPTAIPDAPMATPVSSTLPLVGGPALAPADPAPVAAAPVAAAPAAPAAPVSRTAAAAAPGAARAPQVAPAAMPRAGEGSLLGGSTVVLSWLGLMGVAVFLIRRSTRG